MSRLEVLKTYKLYIGGQFPRTESGRYYPLKNADGTLVANVCLSTRKDFRNSVVAARNAFTGWSAKSAFNRSQVLYRIAEMLEGRKAQFIDELKSQGVSADAATKEVEASIDRFIYYSGWCDKYQQVFGAVNPVASSHFNFSAPDPMGVIGIIADEATSLIGLVSVIAPAIAGGNACIVLASETKPLCAISLGEVLATSDLPGGVVNILTGTSKELISHFASHMDVNALVYCRQDEAEKKILSETGAVSIKRVFYYSKDWMNDESQNPYLILDLQEVKTTWHPIENVGAAGAKY